MKLRLWRRYLRRYRGSEPRVAVCFILSVSQFALVIPTLLMVRFIFDTAVPRGDLVTLVYAGLGMAGLSFAHGGVTLLLRKLALDISKKVIRDLRFELLDKLYSVSRAYLTRIDSSALHSRIVHDSERVDVVTNVFISELLPSLVSVTAISAALLWLNWKLYASLAMLFPMLILVDRVLGSRVQANAAEFRRAFEKFSQGVAFVIDTMDLGRVQNARNGELRRQGHVLDHLRVTSGRMAWLHSAWNICQANVSMLGTLAVLVIGGGYVATGAMSIGSLLSFYLALNLLNSHVRNLMGVVPLTMTGAQSIEALEEILGCEETEPYRGTRRIVFRGEISLRRVSFRYSDTDVLDRVDMHIAPGEHVAIAGANGSGKTTLLHLICGFYRPQHGDVWADGARYDDLDIACLRSQMGVVMQDPVLFSGSIHENIRYGSPDVTQERVEWAARLATAHEFISELPLGYDTPVGDDGVLLSGGQRQKIAIARALLRQPKLLILDEPTNHLDSRAIAQLLRNLRSLPDAPTIVAVSHDAGVLGDFETVFHLSESRMLQPARRAVV